MRTLRVHEAADRYNVSEQTVRKWCREKRLDAEQIGRSWLIYEKERPAQLLAEAADLSDRVLVTSTFDGKFTLNGVA